VAVEFIAVAINSTCVAQSGAPFAELWADDGRSVNLTMAEYEPSRVSPLTLVVASFGDLK